MSLQIVFRILVTLAFLGISFIMLVHGYNKDITEDEYDVEDIWLYFLYIITGITFMGFLVN